MTKSERVQKLAQSIVSNTRFHKSGELIATGRQTTATKSYYDAFGFSGIFMFNLAAEVASCVDRKTAKGAFLDYTHLWQADTMFDRVYDLLEKLLD